MSDMRMTVRDRKFDVRTRLTGDGFSFSTEVDGIDVTADSWEKLRDKLMRQVSAVRVEVPFLEIVRGRDGRRQVHEGIAYGRHAGNRNILIRWSDGSTEQASYRSGKQYRVDQLNRGELDDALRRLDDAERHLAALLDGHKYEYGLGPAVDDAIDRAVRAEGAEA